MKTRSLAAPVLGYALMWPVALNAQTVPQWDDQVRENPRNWQAVKFRQQSDLREVTLWFRFKAAELSWNPELPPRPVRKTKPDADKDQAEVKDVPLFFLDPHPARPHNLQREGATVFAVQNFKARLSPYAADFEYVRDLVKKTADQPPPFDPLIYYLDTPPQEDKNGQLYWKFVVLKAVIKRGSVFKQDVNIIPETEISIYGESRKIPKAGEPQPKWIVQPPNPATRGDVVVYEKSALSNLRFFDPVCQEIPAQFYADGDSAPETQALLFRNILPQEVEIHCSFPPNDAVDGDLYSESLTPTSDETIKLWGKTGGEAKAIAYTQQVRNNFMALVNRELSARLPETLPPEEFDSFEASFLVNRMALAGIEAESFVQAMNAARDKQAFVTKWRAFFRSELKLYVDEAKTLSAPTLDAFKYDKKIETLAARTWKIFSSDRKELKEMYERAGMPDPAGSPEVRSPGALVDTEFAKLSAKEQTAYNAEKKTLDAASVPPRDQRRLDLAERWREIIKDKERVTVGPEILDSAKKKEIVDAYLKEIEALSTTQSDPKYIGDLAARKPITDQYFQKLQVLFAAEEDARRKKAAEDREKTAYQNALQALFPKRQSYEKAFAEAAVVEYLLSKSDDPGLKDEKMRMATVIALAKADAPAADKAAFVDAWKAKAEQAVRQQLTSAPKDEDLNEFLKERTPKIEERNLLDYYCDIRWDKPAPGSGERPQQLAKEELEKMAALYSRQMGVTLEAAKETLSKGFEDPKAFDPLGPKCNDRAQRRLYEGEGGGHFSYTGPGSLDGDVPPPDTGEADKKDDPDKHNSTIAGLKLGVVAAVVGFIFGGPIGMILFALLGIGLGYIMHKEINK